MNIFDVVEIGGRYGSTVWAFTSQAAMVRYSQDEGKLWPQGVK